MENTDFLNSTYVKNLILLNMYDVDEFVLREIERIKNSNMLEHYDVSKAKRYSYEVFQISDTEFEEEEISTNEYLYRKESGDNMCFTRLNYKEFEKEFPLDEMEHWYGDRWLYDFQYNKGFFQALKKWIDETEGDASKKIRIRELIKLIQRSKQLLEAIENNWNEPHPINEIQKKAIEIHLRFDNFMLESISNYYSSIFPELLKNEKVTKLKRNSQPKWLQVARFISTINFEHKSDKYASDYFYFINKNRYFQGKDAAKELLNLGLELKLDDVRLVLTETFINDNGKANDIFYKEHIPRLSLLLEELESDPNRNEWMLAEIKNNIK